MTTASMAATPENVRAYLEDLQSRITTALEGVEGEGGARFLADAWRKGPEERLQGDGVTRILEGGRVFERAGCGFSDVKGPQLPPSATQHRGDPKTCWFGGGMDLTPYYGFEEDAVHFHRACHAALQPFGEQLYPRFKTWCDEYFYLKHRDEQRGIGGIFFDDFSELGQDQSFAMLRAVGDAFLGAYLPIVERRQGMAHGAQQVEFQRYRRGRYVEFNLVWDRGTHFGLQSGGRTESILLSMPSHASWSYQREDAPGTPEHALAHEFLVRRDWI